LSAGALPQTPLGELTALPQTALLYLGSHTSKGRTGGKGKEGKEGTGGEEQEGREEKGGGIASITLGDRCP